MTSHGSEPAPVDLSRVVIDPESVRLLAYGFCKKKRVVVLGRVDPQGSGSVPVGMVDATDGELVGTLRSFLRRPVEAVPMRPVDVQHALDAGYGVVADAAGAAIAVGGALPLSADDPIDALTLDLLQRSAAISASHLHLTPAEHGVTLRVRVDGTLRPLASPIGSEQGPDVVARLATLAGLGGADDTQLQRGTFDLEPPTGSVGPTTRVVVTKASTERGDELVLAMLAPPADAPLGALGLEPAQRDLVHALLTGRDGLVLVAGPAASGRTTTLRSMVGALDRRTRRVIALGDTFAALPEIDVRDPAHLGGQLGAAIEASVDLDADVIVADPLREADDFAAASAAVQRGRLVLATVYGMDAVDAIAALDRAGVPRSTTASMLRGVVAPRLLARSCPHCRVAVAAPDAPSDATASTGQRFEAPGCDACAGVGVLGRIAVFEALWVTPGLADRIAAGTPVHEIRTHAVANGMRTLLDVATARVEIGEVSHAAIRSGLPLRLLDT